MTEAMDTRKKISFAGCAAGLLALGLLVGLWWGRYQYDLWGRLSALACAALFALLGLRFVPRWVEFWSDDPLPEAPEGDEPRLMSLRIFLALLGLDLETGDISRKISRGKNTTRHTELIEKNGIRVMDTAGFNLLEAETALAPETLRERYPEFIPYEGKCRFRECLHDREPGCAVDEAARQGMISKNRLERYRTLLAEAREVWRERYD